MNAVAAYRHPLVVVVMKRRTSATPVVSPPTLPATTDIVAVVIQAKEGSGLDIVTHKKSPSGEKAISERLLRRMERTTFGKVAAVVASVMLNLVKASDPVVVDVAARMISEPSGEEIAFIGAE